MSEQIREALRPSITGTLRSRNYIRPVSQVVLELPGGESSFLAAQKSILRWIRPRARVNLPADAWEGKSFELDETGAQPTEAIALEQPRYWAARLKDADRNVARRDWTIEIGLAIQSPTLAVLGVRLTVSGGGDDGEWNRSIPNLVRNIVQDFEAHFDGLRANIEPRLVATAGDVDDLVLLIESPTRRCDVIVFSLADDETNPATAICDAKGVQRRVAGAAHTFILTGPASLELTRRLGKEWSVFRRAVRTYRSRFNPYEDDLRHHPLTMPSRIVDWPGGVTAYETFLVDQALWRTVARIDLENSVPSFLAVRQTAAQVVLLEARESGSSDSELAKLFEAEAANLRDQITKQRETSDALLDAAQQEIDDLRGEVDTLRTRLHRQSARIDSLIASQRNPVAQQELIPTTLDDIQEWCDSNLAGSIFMAPRAYRGSKDSEYEDISLIYQSLILLRDYYVPMKRSGGPEALKAFENACGELGLTEEATGSVTRAGEEGEEYFVRLAGKRHFLDRHLKKGASREPKHCFRLYFFWDSEDEQVVVGWLPSHLSTRIT